VRDKRGKREKGPLDPPRRLTRGERIWPLRPEVESLKGPQLRRCGGRAWNDMCRRSLRMMGGREWLETTDELEAGAAVHLEARLLGAGRGLLREMGDGDGLAPGDRLEMGDATG